jgi:hypothetical protein
VRFLRIGKKFLLRKSKFKADYVRKFAFSLKKANRYFSVKIALVCLGKRYSYAESKFVDDFV